MPNSSLPSGIEGALHCQAWPGWSSFPAGRGMAGLSSEEGDLGHFIAAGKDHSPSTPIPSFSKTRVREPF